MRGLVRQRLEHVRRVAEGDQWRRYLDVQPAAQGGIQTDGYTALQVG